MICGLIVNRSLQINDLSDCWLLLALRYIQHLLAAFMQLEMLKLIGENNIISNNQTINLRVSSINKLPSAVHFCLVFQLSFSLDFPSNFQFFISSSTLLLHIIIENQFAKLKSIKQTTLLRFLNLPSKRFKENISSQFHLTPSIPSFFFLLNGVFIE